MSTATSWKSTGTLAETRSQHASFIWADRLYVVGGAIGAAAGTSSPTVKSAQLDNAGGVGPWRIEAPLPAARLNLAVVVTPQGRVYAIGGADGTPTDQATVYVSQVQGDGTLAPWKTMAAIPTAIEQHAAVYLNGYIVVVGGVSGVTYQTKVYVARLNSDGTIVSWSTQAALAAALAGHSMAVRDDYIYCFGGTADGSTPSAVVQSARLGVDGSIVAWSKVGLLSTARWLHASAKLNNLVYIIGGTVDGSSSLATVEAMRLQAGGTVGTDIVSTTLATVAVRAPSAVLAPDGKIMVSGGLVSAGNANLSTIQVGDANRSDGLI